MQVTVKVDNLKADHHAVVVPVDIETSTPVPGLNCPHLHSGESVTLDVPDGARVHVAQVEDRDVSKFRDYMRG